jgi:hypothetical protein
MKYIHKFENFINENTENEKYDKSHDVDFNFFKDNETILKNDIKPDILIGDKVIGVNIDNVNEFFIENNLPLLSDDEITEWKEFFNKNKNLIIQKKVFEKKRKIWFSNWKKSEYDYQVFPDKFLVKV